MKGVIDRYKFDGVWHFTDRSNIQSIVDSKHLFSLAEATRRAVTIPAPGGNSWSHDADRAKALDEYVHLAFVDDHPMQFVAQTDGRLPNPIFLKIKSEIILQEGVLFTNDVSNKSGVEAMDQGRAENEIDFEVLFTYMDWTVPEIQTRRQAAVKSEILVPKSIALNMILGYKNG